MSLQCLSKHTSSMTCNGVLDTILLMLKHMIDCGLHIKELSFFLSFSFILIFRIKTHFRLLSSVALASSGSMTEGLHAVSS